MPPTLSATPACWGATKAALSRDCAGGDGDEHRNWLTLIC
jgi:hypothetical protein